DSPGNVVEDKQLAGVVFCKADNPNVRLAQLLVFTQRLLLPVIAKCPNTATIVIAVNVRAAQFGQLLAMVFKAAGERTEVGVVVFDNRHQDGAWPAGPFGAKGMAAFEHAPAVVAALFDQVHLLPQILAHIAAPEVAGGPVKAELPGLAQA